MRKHRENVELVSKAVLRAYDVAMTDLVDRLFIPSDEPADLIEVSNMCPGNIIYVLLWNFCRSRARANASKKYNRDRSETFYWFPFILFYLLPQFIYIKSNFPISTMNFIIYWRSLEYQGNFAPVPEIGDKVRVQVIEGQVPKDFPPGCYVRNGTLTCDSYCYPVLIKPPLGDKSCYSQVTEKSHSSCPCMR